jgi:hypothetical protein
MRSNALLRALTIAGLGVAGLVGGHAAGYAISVPDAYHRSALLEATGHGYLPSASRLAVMLGIAAVVAGVASGYLHRPRTAHPSFARAAAGLVSLQCGGFVVLEVVERLLAGAPLGSLSLPLLVAGLLTQAVVGFGLALLLVGLRRLGACLRASAELVAAAPGARRVFASVLAPVSRAPVRDRVRGPPAFRMA